MIANSFFNSKASEGPAERTERTLPGGEVTEPVLETAPVLPVAEPVDEVVEARLIPGEETEEEEGLAAVERVVVGLAVVDLRGVRVVVVGVLVAVAGLVEVAVVVRVVVVGVVLVAVAVVVGVRRAAVVEGVVVDGVVVGALRTVVVVGVAVPGVVRLAVVGDVAEVVGVREDVVVAVLVGVAPVGLMVVLVAPAAPAALALLAATLAAVAARRAATEEGAEAPAPGLLLGLAGVLEVFAEVALLLGLAGTVTPASSGAGVEGTASSSSRWWSAVSAGWSTGAGDSSWV
jgi:hypothetical protein